ncbi:MAG: ABC transporter ATP-binding protein [Candidatus Nanopelagicales bacterium]
MRDVSKVFQLHRQAGHDGRLVALDGVSFSLEQGGSIAVVGESGSGKSTLARIICGLETPTAGQVLFRGQPRTAFGRRSALRAHARQVQMVFQDPYSSLDPRQSGFGCLDEVLRVHTDFATSDREKAIRSLGDQVGLGSKELESPPRRLSGGQRQRLAIARALAVDPSVLILDEAVSALDVSVQAQILNLLVEIRRARGLSYVFVSHDLAVVRQISEDVIVMRRGKIVEAGRTADVLANPQQPYTRLLRESVPRRGWTPQRSLALVDGDSAE